MRQNGRALGHKLILIFALLALAAPPQGAAPKPLVPASATSILADPKAFDGQMVTVYAAVDRILSPTSFTVDQDVTKSGTGDLLVVAPRLTAPVALNTYVTVIGEVTTIDGRLAIRATTVLDPKLVDLAKAPPVPLTPEEAAFDAVMKRVGPAFNALRSGVTASDAAVVTAQTATLRQAFADTEAFFKSRGKEDAQQWAAEARAHVAALEKSAGNWDAAKASVSALQQTCASCHAVYRERQDDGSYRIRQESK